MNTPPRPKAEPFPVLLNVSDAMLFAADKLDRMCGALELIAIIADVLGKARPASHPDGADEGHKAQEELRTMVSGIVDKDLQLNAMRAAARQIRQAAHETKLVEARVSVRGIRT